MYPPQHPSHLPKCIIKLRFVANPFATGSPKVTSWKPNLIEEFGSFLFFIFSISLKWGSFWSFCGQMFGCFEVLKPSKMLLWSYLARNMLWCGYGNKIELSYWTFEGFAIFFLRMVTFHTFRSLWGHVGQLSWDRVTRGATREPPYGHLGPLWP